MACPALAAACLRQTPSVPARRGQDPAGVPGDRLRVWRGIPEEPGTTGTNSARRYTAQLIEFTLVALLT